jgi:RHS repeat-associated protein
VDTSGNVQERYVYDPYGAVTILTPNWATRGISSFGWVFLHQGGRFDNATGLYIFRNRDFSPTLGRWLQLDPARFPGLATNDIGISEILRNLSGDRGPINNSLRNVQRQAYRYQVDFILPLLRAPYYNSSTGKFLNNDPAGLSRVDMNFYRYVTNNPTDFADPTGLWELKCKEIVITGQIGAILGPALFGPGVGNQLGPYISTKWHCWVTCDGKSYQLDTEVQWNQKWPFVGVPNMVEPTDPVVYTDKGPDKCKCIAANYAANSRNRPYNPFDCNSNWYANQLLKCCGVNLPQPKPQNAKPGGPNALGWDQCSWKQKPFKCCPAPLTDQ